jgi:hypothetical protein
VRVVGEIVSKFLMSATGGFLMAKLACLDLSCLHFIPAFHRYVPSFIVNDSTKVEDLCVLECDAVSGRAFRDDWKNCAGYLHIMTNCCTVLVYVIACE